MLTRKQGPPVPPRPTGLPQKPQRDTSPSSTQNGRTVVYKSPSLDKHINEKNYNNLNITNKTSECILNGNKTEIIITNNSVDDVNNNLNHSPVITHTGTIELKKPSPVPAPRQIKPIQQIKNTNLISSNGSYSSPPSSPTCVTVKSDIKNFQNIIEIDPKDKIHITNEENKSNEEVIIINSSSSSSSTVSNIEVVNNTRNVIFEQQLVNELRMSKESLIEAKNNEINVENYVTVCSTPSPPSSLSKGTVVRFNLNHRPEPEGGEIHDNESHKEHNYNIFNTTQHYDENLPNEKKAAFHELLISELAAMRKGEKYLNKKCENISSAEISPNGTQRSRIRTSDWVEVGDNGKEVLLSSCQISLEDSGLEDEERIDDTSSGVGDSWDSIKDTEERSRMSLPGLPPLPKSLSGVELTGIQQLQNSTPTFGQSEAIRGINQSMPPRMPSTLDTQLAILRREMYGLRQLDLSLLSQLWALNESIQEFRSMMQEQDTLSPPSPSPSPSDANSVTSEDDDDMSLETPISRMRSAPPPPPPNRKAPSRPV